MHRIVCKDGAGCEGGIFYIQEVIREYLKLSAFLSMRQKKTTVCLKISVIVRVQDVKIIKVPDHTRAKGVTHKIKPCRGSSDLNSIYFFRRGQGRVNIEISREYWRFDVVGCQASGNLKSLIYWPTHIRQKSFYCSKYDQSFSNLDEFLSNELWLI